MSDKKRNPVHKNMQRCGAGAHETRTTKRQRARRRERTVDILDEYYMDPRFDEFVEEEPYWYI